MIRFLGLVGLTALLLGSINLPASSQWGPRGCGPVGPIVSPTVIIPAAPALPRPLLPPNPITSNVKIAGPTFEGVEVQVDLPIPQRIRNIGSRRDGAGMCVMSSIEMMFHWVNLEGYRGLRDWAANEAGGAYPQKVDDQLSRYSSVRHIQAAPYFQYEGPDPALLLASLRSGRPVAVTYSGSDGVRYNGPISHMVLLVHFDGTRVGILDNNAIGENELLWMPLSDFLTRWRSGGQGWAVFCTAPPPPPPPHN